MPDIDADFERFWKNEIVPKETHFEKFNCFIREYKKQIQPLMGSKFSERFFEKFLTEATNFTFNSFKSYPKNQNPIHYKFGGHEIPKKFDLYVEGKNQTLFIDIKKYIDMIEKDLFKAYLASEDVRFQEKYAIFLLPWEEKDKSKDKFGNKNQYWNLLEEFRTRKIIYGFCYLIPDDESNFQSQLNELLKVLNLV